MGMRRKLPQAGMTLLDCLIAIGLLTIGGVGLLGVQIVAMGANIQARALEQATRLAEERMETLSYATTVGTTGADQVDGAGCTTGLARCTQVGQIYQRSWVVGAGNPVSLQITVSWTDGQGRTHQVVLDGVR